MSKAFFVGDEFQNGYVRMASEGHDTLEACLSQLSQRRLDYAAFPATQRPMNFVILRLQMKSPFVVPVGHSNGS